MWANYFYDVGQKFSVYHNSWKKWPKKSSEIRTILEDKRATENQLRVNRQRLVKVLHTDLTFMELESGVKPSMTLAEVREIPICEFTKWCLLRILNEDTIMKLIEQDIIDVHALSYIKSYAVDQFNFQTRESS